MSEHPSPPRPVDVTPRGWLVGCLAATVLLGLLASGIGVLASRAADPDPANDPGPVAAPTRDTTPTEDPAPPDDRPAPNRTPSTPASPAPKGTASSPPAIPQHGPGTYRRGTVRLDNAEPRGRVIRYTVRVENGVPVDPTEAARFIHGVLNDKRSWGGDGSVTWLYVPSGKVDLTASITTPDTTDRLCRPLRTDGKVSCRNQDVIALNALRWTRGVPHYNGDLTGYKQYLVNHEFGHFLGYGHVECPGAGKRAPVMMTQTFSLGKCTKNPWPANDP